MAKSFWDEEDFRQVNNGSFWDEQDFINTNRVAPQTVSTPQGTSNSSPIYPQVEQSPVVEQPASVGEAFATATEGLRTKPLETVGNALSNVWNGIIGAGQTTVDNLSKNGIAGVGNTIGSFVQGAYDSVPTIIHGITSFGGNMINRAQGKAENPYVSMPSKEKYTEQTIKEVLDAHKRGEMSAWESARSLAPKNIEDALRLFGGDSKLVNQLQSQKEQYPLANLAGDMVVPGVSLAKTGANIARLSKASEKAQKLGKLEKSEKLAKMAKKAKSIDNAKKFGESVVLGGAFGASSEHKTLEEQLGGIGEGALTGGLLHVGMKGAGKAYKKAEPKVNEAIHNLSEMPWASNTIANIDNALHTNLSKHATKETQLRKEYKDMLAQDNSLARNMTEERAEALKQAEELTPQEQLEVYERNTQGNKKYAYADNKAKQKQKDQEAREQQEAKEFFDNLLEEENASTAPVSEVSNPVDINTPKLEGTAVKTHELPASINPQKSYKEKIAGQQEIIEKEGGVKASDPSKLNIDIKSQIEAKRRSKPRSFVVEKSGDNTYFHGEDGVSKVYNKNGKSAYVAEGARSLEKRTAGEENIYERYDELFEKPEEGVSKRYLREGIHETSVDQPVYQYAKNESPEFMKWYDEYSKADSKTKNKMLSEKLKSYKTQDEASAFYEKFSEYEMKGNERKRAGKVGDETYDTADVSEAERLTKVIEEEDIQYEKAEPEIDVHSSGFRKLLETSWNKMPRGKAKNAKTYIKGKLNAWRESADFQKEYDKIVKQLSGKGFSPKIQEAMLSDINTIADSVIESKKKFGVTYKKTRNITQNIYNQLVEANKTGQLAKGKQIIDSNNLKHKYVDENMKNALKEHYIDSVEKANAKLNAMGVEKNAQGEYVFNQEKAIEWAKNESKSKYKNNSRKLAKDLNLLEKSPEVALERAKNAINKIISANKNIIANDTRFAFEAPQKKLKEISAKGDQQRWKVEETGDTWDRKSSDVDAGERLANKATTTLENIYNRDLGKEYLENRSKSISKVIEDIDKMTTKEIIDAWDKYGKDLDQHYMNNSGKDVVPNSELPSAKYFEAKKRVDTIKSFDESVKANSELKAGKISNKDYAEFGADENLKQYAKDYPDKEIIIETCDDPSVGGAFSIKTENMHFYTNYTGKTPMAHIKKHEFRHSQQWKDPSKRESLEELAKITNEAGELKTIIKDNGTFEKVVSLHKQGKLKLVDKKDGSLSKRTIDKLNTLLGNDAKAFIEWYNKEAQCKGHTAEVDAENFAKGVNDDTVWSRNIRTNTINNGIQSDVRGATRASRTRGNSKGKMDEANTEAKSIQEEKVVKFIEDEFNQPTEEYSKFESDNAKVRSVQAHFKTLDKKRTSWYKDFSTFSDEQMENRIKQQGGEFGDAVYFLQGGAKQGKVKFGEQENIKVGMMGEKKVDGVSQRGTTLQSLGRLFSIDVRQNAVSNRIKFLEEHFSKPNKDYVEVNRNLFANAMLFGKSKTFFETLSKGEQAIRETFTNKDVADAWVELANRCEADGRKLYLPKDMYNASITGEWELPLDYMKTYGKGLLKKEQIKGMGKIAGAMLDYYNDRFKRKVLTSASFFTNNRFGNQIMLIANASSPAEYFRGIKDAITLKDSDIPSEILESTLAEAVWQETGGNKKSWNPVQNVTDNLAGDNPTKRYFSSNQNNPFDNLVRILDGVAVDTKGLTGGKKLLAHGANIALAFPNAVFKEISSTMMEINAKAERFERKQAFAQTLNKIQKDKVTQTARKMATVKHLIEEIKSDSILRQTVIDKVADVLGDYNNFNKVEKNFLKRIIPFYAWNRTIVRHSIALCKDNPTKLALIALKTLELHAQDDGLEDYQHGALKTNIYDKTSGKNLVINKTKMIPYATLFDMASGESIGSISPGIKKPIEAVQGEKWFKPSSEIQNKRYKRMSHKGQKGYLDTKTGEFKEGGLPAGVRLAYVGKDALETVYPHIGSPLTKGVLSKDVIDHHNKTGEWRLPDKQYDASLGGFYDGDYIGSYNGKAKKRSAKMKMDLEHQVANRLTGLSLQPEQRKAKKEKWQKQSRKLRGY